MAKKNLKKLVDSGVKWRIRYRHRTPRRIQGYFEQWEMELMTDAGLTPQQGHHHGHPELSRISRRKGSGHAAEREVGGSSRARASPLDNIKEHPHIEAVWIGVNQVEMT